MKQILVRERASINSCWGKFSSTASKLVSVLVIILLENTEFFWHNEASQTHFLTSSMF